MKISAEMNQGQRVNRRRAIAVSVLVLIALLLGLSGVEAQGTASVTVSPAVRNVPLGTYRTVDILVNDYNDPNTSPLGPGLYGADVQLTFDPTIVQVWDAIPGSGVQMEPGPLLASEPHFILFNTANNATGTIRFVISQLNPAPPQTCPTPPTPCSGVLLTITFYGQALGTSPLNFTLKKLSNASGFEIPSTSVNGSLVVGTPTAVSVADFRSTNAGAGGVELVWNTGNEISLAGFNVWRSLNSDTGYSKLNSDLIPAKNPGAVIGNAYSFTDEGATAGAKHYYKLEAVAADSSSEWFGPILVDISPDCPQLSAKLSPVELHAPAKNAQVARKVTMDWSESGCAKQYRIQLRRDSPEGLRVRNKKFAETKLSLQLDEGHTYYWRVRAVSGKRKSIWTEWRSFTVRD
jgi:hypothetical protein